MPTPPLPALAVVCAAALAACAIAEDFQGSTHPIPHDEAPINYSAATPDDPIARLQARLDAGEAKLKFDNQYGWLPALLEVLKVPKSSQMLVFSKTSLQRTQITPQNPRALYFNDDIYLGYIPGAPVMEVSAVDPKLGGMFYSIEQLPARKPKFVRDSDCIRCHASARTLGVPGHVVRSIATDETGELDAQNEFGPIDHCTPFAERWAGWYVTGTHGEQAHRGNLVGAEAFRGFEKEPLAKGNLRSLDEFFETKKYLEPGSDIVALMVLEHQAKMHNYITRLNYETQTMLAAYGHIRYLKSQVNAFLRYLLFTEETPLTAPVAGNPAYLQDFAAMGPRDAKGRSLRDFELQSRLFKYPCSFLIYSEAFDKLQPQMREHLLERLWDILTGKDQSPEFAALTAAQRREILEILRETKPNLPSYWREALTNPLGDYLIRGQKEGGGISSAVWYGNYDALPPPPNRLRLHSPLLGIRRGHHARSRAAPGRFRADALRRADPDAEGIQGHNRAEDSHGDRGGGPARAPVGFLSSPSGSVERRSSAGDSPRTPRPSRRLPARPQATRLAALFL